MTPWKLALIYLKEHIGSVFREPFCWQNAARHASNYYLGDVMAEEEVAAVQAATESNNVDVLNIRLVLRFHACTLLFSN